MDWWIHIWYKTPARRKCRGWWNHIPLPHQFPNYLKEIFPTNLSQLALSPSHVEQFKSNEMPSVFWVLYEISLTSLILFVEFNLTFSVSPKSVIIVFRSFVTASYFSGSPYFTSLEEAQITWTCVCTCSYYWSSLIIIRRLLYLIVFLEPQGFLVRSWFVRQYEFWWFAYFYKTAYNTTLTFLMGFVYHFSGEKVPRTLPASVWKVKSKYSVLQDRPRFNKYPYKLVAEHFIVEKKVLFRNYKVLTQKQFSVNSSNKYLRRHFAKNLLRLRRNSFHKMLLLWQFAEINSTIARLIDNHKNKFRKTLWKLLIFPIEKKLSNF